MWNAAVSAGNDFTVSGGFSLRPELGFDYLSAKMKHYRESGGDLALNVDPERYDSFRSSAGLVANWRPLDTLRLFVSGHWHHEFADKNVALRSAIRSLDTMSFTTEGRNLGRDSGTAGLGLEWTLPAPLEMGLSLDYMRTFSKTYSSNEINASFTVYF